jgi:FkbM family methyltransferase
MTLPAANPSIWWTSLPDGVRIGVPDDLREMSRWVLEEQGDWFEDELRFVRGWFPEGGTAIDVGANYGCYTLSLAKRCGPTGRVIAFEPGASVAAILERSVQANGFEQIRIVQAAVSDRSGTGWLRHLHTSELGELAEPGSDEGPGESVDLVSLDDHLAASPVDRLDYLKIDAEGAELAVLRGAESSLAAHSPLVMVELIHSGRLNVGLCEALRQHGFDLYRLVPGLMVLAPFDDSVPADPFQMNVFACRADRAEELRRSGHLVTGHTSPVPVDRGGLESWVVEHGECPRDPDWGAVPAPMLQSMAEYAAAMELDREAHGRRCRAAGADDDRAGPAGLGRRHRGRSRLARRGRGTSEVGGRRDSLGPWLESTDSVIAPWRSRCRDGTGSGSLPRGDPRRVRADPSLVEPVRGSLQRARPSTARGDGPSVIRHRASARDGVSGAARLGDLRPQRSVESASVRGSRVPV